MNIVFLLFLQFFFRLCSFFSHFPFIPSLSLSVLQQQFSVALTIVQSTQLFIIIIILFSYTILSTLDSNSCPCVIFRISQFFVFLCFCVFFPPLDSLLFRFHVGFRNRFGGWKIMWTLHIFNLLNDLTFFFLFSSLLCFVDLCIFTCAYIYCDSTTCSLERIYEFLTSPKFFSWGHEIVNGSTNKFDLKFHVNFHLLELLLLYLRIINIENFRFYSKQVVQRTWRNCLEFQRLISMSFKFSQS